MDSERFNRQLQFFGEKGQIILREAKVSIIGLGGVGSHIVQQLAFLGVGKIILVDNDKLSKSNLNRLIGARDTDQIGMPKVDIAKRLIHTINPSIEVIKIKDVFISRKAFEEVKQSHFVFGSVDNDGARLVINEYCLAYEIPFIDAASDIVEDGSEYGGRVISCLDDQGCLYCRGEIDGIEARRYLSNPKASADEMAIYGINKYLLDGGGPSVVSINGIIASIAVTEFMAQVTGIRPAKSQLTYYGSKGIVRLNNDHSSHDCYYCKCVRGKGDSANVERYVSH